MGRTIIIEETVEDYISSLYGIHQWQLGLIIGQLSVQRDYILHLSRTPEQLDAKCKAASPEDVENSWIIEHARQVSRMLTGGLDVIGVFAFGPPDMLAKSQTKLRQLLFSINKTVQHKPGSYFDDFSHNRVMLQICSATKKITCRTIDVSDQRATPNPAELKYQAFASKWLKLETSLSLPHGQFSVPRKLERSSMQNQIASGIHRMLQSISNALCTVNGELCADEQLLVPGEKTGKLHGSSKNTQMFKVDIFTEKPYGSTKIEEIETVSSLTFSGSMCCQAFVHPKATVKEAIQTLKYDVIRSFLSRLEVLCEDIMDNQEDKINEEAASSTWTCPQRVFAPLGTGVLTVCDYVFKDETLKESQERMAELLDIEPKEEDFECIEDFPDVHTVRSLLEEMENDSSKEEMADEEPIEEGIGARVIGAVAGIVVAVLAAGMTFLWGEQAG